MKGITRTEQLEFQCSQLQAQLNRLAELLTRIQMAQDPRIFILALPMQPRLAEVMTHLHAWLLGDVQAGEQPEISQIRVEALAGFLGARSGGILL